MNRSANLSWPFSKRVVDPAERSNAVNIYRRLFTQPRKLASLRAEFDAAVHEGSEKGTTPELIKLLRSHASKITGLVSDSPRLRKAGSSATYNSPDTQIQLERFPACKATAKS